ncbi:MAG: hypothetical protein JWN04_1171 [Myxococcaceae bacterium]|nr:hypothetical protein [Myxococcaceae bacterium]
MIRRLEDHELAHTPVGTLRELAGSRERRHAAAVVSSLRAFMHEELALTGEQIDDLQLELERALLLHERLAR